MTLEDLLYKIGETAIKNKIINFSAVGGDIYDLNVENIKDYPVLFASPTGSHQVRENTTDYEVTFYFLDRLLSDSVNDVQIYSTAIEQLKLILNMVENMKGVLDVSDDYDIQNFTETERMNDRVAGAFSTVNITVKNENECCDTEFITLMLKLENKTLNVTKNGKYTVTYNKIYDGLRKVDVDVNVDLETPYNEGFADGKEEGLAQGYASGKTDGITEGIDQGKVLASAEAIVVNTEKNGTIYTKFSEDIPEITETLTGVDFYNYANINNKTFLTDVKLNDNSVIEFWHRPDWTTSMVSRCNIFSIEGGFRIYYVKDRENYWYLSLQDGTVIPLNGIVYEEWNHYKITKDTITINGVVQDITGEGVFGNGDFIIGDYNDGTVKEIGYYTSGDYGMVIADENRFIPSSYGFINENGDSLEAINQANNVIYFFYYVADLPIVYDNLIKEIKIDIKLDVNALNIKFGKGDLSCLKYFDWTKVGGTDFKEMFYSGKAGSGDFDVLSTVNSKWVTSLESTFEWVQKKVNDNYNLDALANWDTSNVTTMKNMFNGVRIIDGQTITNFDFLNNWNVSKVTDMSDAFNVSYSQAGDNLYSFLANWDTSNVYNMSSMLSLDNIKSLPMIDCTSLGVTNEYNASSIWTEYSNLPLENFGGMKNLKTSWNNSYGLAKCPNLTRESCINILNGLYDFVGNSQTPSSSQGKLKVHANFLKAVGSDISIATNKGWQVSA